MVDLSDLFANSQPVEVDLEYVEMMSEMIGKSNVRYNPYQSMLKYVEQFKEYGLTPKIIHDPLTGATYVTSEEHINHKLH